ncbi:MAG: MbcA/ParS/Xre antitoxin family protein [Rhodobacteraceae bacterium]|nr:MbcA/ParS/Xre antitoxin family protein [Paracoccaceae bacterium]MCY4139287.1 MbcA/ParS/Xre antitoxin family protein [Paracoccaceae bacterium]
MHILFTDPARGHDWIGEENAALGGTSALRVMLGGELTDLMRVRRYLDAERGAW